MIPARAKATRSPPIPQPRSTSVDVRRSGHPARAVGGDGQPGGLLEALVGEVHPGREVTELRDRPPAQLDLGEGRGDLLRGRRTPQRGLRPQRVAGGGRGLLEQALAGVGEQPAEGVEVHPAILAHRRTPSVAARTAGGKRAGRFRQGRRRRVVTAHRSARPERNHDELHTAPEAPSTTTGHTADQTPDRTPARSTSCAPSSGATVHVPADAGWDRARSAWAVHVDQQPLAVVDAADEDDVRRSVRWAVRHGFQVTAQPVGHGASRQLAGGGWTGSC